MMSTTGLVQIHTILSYVFLGLALILNTTIFILVRKAEKLDSFRYVFFAYCIADVMFAVAHAVSLMYWVHLSSTILFFPTGPLAYVPILTPIAFQMQALAYVFVMCLVCSTFLHRYKLVNRLTPLFHSRLRSRIINALVYFPVFQWLFTCAILMQPNAQFRERANQLLGSKFELDFERIYLVGVDISVLSEVLLVLFASAVSLFIELSVLINVIVLCGRGIHRFIKSSMSSEKSKSVQRHVLKLLIFQAIHPLCLLYAPSIINAAQLVLDVQFSEEINFSLALCIAIFPVTNPILTLVLSRELRSTIISIIAHLRVARGTGHNLSAVTIIPSSISPRI